MLNTESTYVEAGYKAGQAMKQRDPARYEHWKRWFRSARACESESDREYVDKLWTQGYSEANPARKPEYFR